MPGLRSQGGYSLIEIIIVIIILGILASVAMQPLESTNVIIRTEETKTEMASLAFAITGNPELISNGVRTDYGYIGDIGALPPNWDALVTNPGGFATWRGPYIQDDFAATAANVEFKYDAWGTAYSTPNAASFSSTGSGETITRQLATTTADLLYNAVNLSITDLDYSPPGSNNTDSIRFILTCPNGSGGMRTLSKYPTANGLVVFDSIPIGMHTLNVVYIPDGDTISRKINVNPGEDYYGDIQYFADVWKPDTASGGGPGSGIELVAGSDTLHSMQCSELSFWIVNNSGAAIDVSGLTLSWASPTAYYQSISWSGSTVRSGSPALTDGDAAVFTGTRTINDGQSIRIYIQVFRAFSNGGGPKVDMTGTSFNVDLSDGSSFTFTADECSN